MSQQPFKYHDVLYRAGVPCEVVRVLPDKLQLENMQTGELRDATVDDLLKEYTDSKLRVGLKPDDKQAERPVAERANADTGLEQLGEKARAATIRRITWITKLDDMGAFERPRLMGECIQRVAEELGEESPPHVSTIRRWRRKLQQSKKDVRALFARLDLRGGRGGTRFPVGVEAAITNAVDRIFLGQKRASAAEVRNAVELEVRRLNQYRLETEQLPVPSLRTIQSRLARLYAFDVTVARHGVREAHRKYGDSVGARPTTRILQIVEVDHTPVDLWVVDESGVVLSKPNLTLLLDRHSRCVLGWFLSLESRGVDTVFGAMRHALLPKTYVEERYREVQGKWRCYGWMEKVVADNGPEFASKDYETALLNLGIVLEFAGAYEPNHKPHIERFFRTFNHGFIHRLKGTSLARVSDRKGEELQQDACITLAELERLIHVWVIDVYHQRPHAGLDGRTPAAVWAESAEVYPPRLKVDVDTLDVELSEVDERSLGRGGVEINNNRYTSERLCALRRMLPEKSKVKVKHRRANVGHVFVLDPFSREYFRVDNVKADKDGLSLEQDKTVRQLRRAADPDSSLQVASAEAVIRDHVDGLLAAKGSKNPRRAAKVRGDSSAKTRPATAKPSGKGPVSPAAEVSPEVFDTPAEEFAEEVH